MSAGKGFMEKLLRAYLQGAAFGPISAFPATLLLFLPCGHWLLEAHLDEVVSLMRDFLERVRF
jgi:hypothetical protein